MAKKVSNAAMAGGIAVLAIVIVLGALILNQQSVPAPVATTVATSVPTSMSTSVPTSTTVSNFTTAVGPNLATCNGYNYSTSRSNYRIVGSCNWRTGLIHVTVYGGPSGATLNLVQQNVTATPFSNTTSVGACATSASVLYLPSGNYKVTFTTGPIPTATCGAASFRLSIS